MAEGMFISLSLANKWADGRFASISTQSFEDQTVVVCVFDTSLSISLFSSVGIINKAKGTVEWGEVKRYDDGCFPSVSLVRVEDKLYAVETHKAEFWRNCFYSVGLVNVQAKNVGWKGSVHLSRGQKPKVSADRNGTVVIIHEHDYGSSMQLHIGDARWVEQAINWRSSSQITHFQGSEPNVTICNNKVIIVCRGDGNKIDYKVGTYKEQDHSIAWGSLESLPEGNEAAGIGEYPSISLNSNGNVIEAHQTTTLVMHQLCYTCGRLKNSSITWAESGKSDMGEYPSVSLFDEKCFFTVHKTNLGPNLFYRQGKLEN